MKWRRISMVRTEKMKRRRYLRMVREGMEEGLRI